MENEIGNCLVKICSITLNSIIVREGIVNAKLYNLFFTSAYLLPIILKEKNNELCVTTNVNDEYTEDISKGGFKTPKSIPTENPTIAGKDESFDRALEISRKHKTRGRLMVYLADSRAYLHVYSMMNLKINS